MELVDNFTLNIRAYISVCINEITNGRLKHRSRFVWLKMIVKRIFFLFPAWDIAPVVP